jgi:cytochrome P450
MSEDISSTKRAYGSAADKPVIVPRGRLRLPPGLRWNLPFYLFSRFFKPGNPILLFEHLRQFGRAAHYRLLWNDIVVLHDPEDIREVLVDKAGVFVKERTQRRMKILLGEGLITADGESHRRHRRIAAPAFHRQRIQAYAGTIVELAQKRSARWRDGERLDVAAEMMGLALEITARTLFDTEVTAAIQAVNDETNAVMEIYNTLIALPRAEWLLTAHAPVPALMQFRRAKRRLDAVVDQMIAAKQREIEERQGQGAEIGDDVLSMLIAARDDGGEQAQGGMARLSSRELRDEVLTIFLAGYETVANALTWMWKLVSEHPEVETRLLAEVDEVVGTRAATLEDAQRLKYVEMVVAETMRLYPPAWAMGRQATEEVEIGPYRLPKGCFVFFSQYIVQRDAQYFPQPLRFDPERFTPEAKSLRPKFAYFPFGSGGRQCIGEAFAWMEAVLVMATLAQRWRMRLEPEQRIALQPKITLRPAGAVWMRAEERRAVAEAATMEEMEAQA